MAEVRHTHTRTKSEKGETLQNPPARGCSLDLSPLMYVVDPYTPARCDKPPHNVLYVWFSHALGE
eukprot:8667078-Pyramimonas_sp.AAC.1